MKYLSSFVLLATAMVSTRAATIKVKVGMNSTGTLATVFDPNQVTAAVGDMIQFEFMGKNHTVTQSSFAEPCTRQMNTVLNLAGADSGFMPVPANATEIPTWTIQVNDASSPQWFFCNQAQHCNAGMVFAINAPTTGEKSFDTWLAKAANATHPDPALNVTAPFTPPAAASPTSDPLASPTEAPGSATSVISSESGSSVQSGSLSLSSGGTAVADNVSGTTRPSVTATSRPGNAGYQVRVGAPVTLLVALAGALLL